MSAFLASLFGAGGQFFTNTGAVLAGGKLYTYSAGTTTAQATWTDSTQAVPNANPLVLDSAGRLTTEIWLASGTSCKFILKDGAGSTLGTWDNLPGINDTVAATLSEWVAGTTPTYVSASSFTLSGNLTATYQTNRRVQFTVAGGTYYGTVSSSTYSGLTLLTTVNITADSTGLDSSLSAVRYGLLSATNQSIPFGVFAPLASAALTGNPTAPTQSVNDNSTKLATTAYVQTQVTTQGGLTLITASTPSGVAAVDFTTGIDGTYDEYELRFQNLIPSSGSVALWLRTSANAGASWDSSASNYVYAGLFQNSDGTTTANTSAGATQIVIAASASGTAASGGVSGVIRIVDPAATACDKHVSGLISTSPSAGGFASGHMQGVRAATTAVNGIRLMFSGANVQSGKVKLYGVRKS